MTARRRRASAVSAVAAGFLWAAVARAQASGAAPAGGGAPATERAPSPPSATTVAVIRPAAGDAVLTEASLRIRSELDAAGTSNLMIDCPGPAAPDRRDCADSSSAARISLFREEGIATIQVMASLPDGLELRRHVRVPPDTGGDDPSVLAVRAVELLRDIYLDIPRVAHRPGPKPAPATPTAARPAESPWSWVSGRAFAGVGVLQGRWGLGAAPGPVLGFGVVLASRLNVLATVAGPFHKTLGTDLMQPIDTSQTLATLQLRYELGALRLRPFFTAGGGLFALRAQDQSQLNAGLVLVGVGLLVRLVPWVAVTLDAQETVTWPSLDVVADKMVIGRAGSPSELVELSLVLSAP